MFTIHHYCLYLYLIFEMISLSFSSSLINCFFLCFVKVLNLLKGSSITFAIQFSLICHLSSIFATIRPLLLSKLFYHRFSLLLLIFWLSKLSYTASSIHIFSIFQLLPLPPFSTITIPNRSCS